MERDSGPGGAGWLGAGSADGAGGTTGTPQMDSERGFGPGELAVWEPELWMAREGLPVDVRARLGAGLQSWIAGLLGEPVPRAAREGLLVGSRPP